MILNSTFLFAFADSCIKKKSIKLDFDKAAHVYLKNRNIIALDLKPNRETDTKTVLGKEIKINGCRKSEKWFSTLQWWNMRSIGKKGTKAHL